MHNGRASWRLRACACLLLPLLLLDQPVSAQGRIAVRTKSANQRKLAAQRKYVTTYTLPATSQIPVAPEGMPEGELASALEMSGVSDPGAPTAAPVTTIVQPAASGPVTIYPAPALSYVPQPAAQAAPTEAIAPAPYVAPAVIAPAPYVAPTPLVESVPLIAPAPLAATAPALPVPGVEPYAPPPAMPYVPPPALPYVPPPATPYVPPVPTLLWPQPTTPAPLLPAQQTPELVPAANAATPGNCPPASVPPGYMLVPVVPASLRPQAPPAELPLLASQLAGVNRQIGLLRADRQSLGGPITLMTLGYGGMLVSSTVALSAYAAAESHSEPIDHHDQTTLRYTAYAFTGLAAASLLFGLSGTMRLIRHIDHNRDLNARLKPLMVKRASLLRQLNYAALPGPHQLQATLGGRF
ncbi:MAG: hypothetical protein QM778_31035 [Myxococcales bacterium]